jgi:hypothetical protein
MSAGPGSLTYAVRSEAREICREHNVADINCIPTHTGCIINIRCNTEKNAAICLKSITTRLTTTTKAVSVRTPSPTEIKIVVVEPIDGDDTHASCDPGAVVVKGFGAQRNFLLALFYGIGGVGFAVFGWALRLEVQ